jgi:hypothetical protein
MSYMSYVSYVSYIGYMGQGSGFPARHCLAHVQFSIFNLQFAICNPQHST